MAMKFTRNGIILAGSTCTPLRLLKEQGLI
jgi:hypothetical protein